MNIYQSNTYRKDLSWLYFYDDPRVQERQQMLKQSYIPVSVAYIQVEARSTSQMTTVFHARPLAGFIEIQSNLKRKNLHRTNQGPNFLGGSFQKRKDNRE